jgi:hypothetical protein
MQANNRINRNDEVPQPQNQPLPNPNLDANFDRVLNDVRSSFAPLSHRNELLAIASNSTQRAYALRILTQFAFLRDHSFGFQDLETFYQGFDVEQHRVSPDYRNAQEVALLRVFQRGDPYAKKIIDQLIEKCK